MSDLAAVVTLVISVANGVPMTVKNCELFGPFFERRRAVSVYCEVTNAGDRAIAAYNYNIASYDIGRELKWEETQDQSADVSGGIEPAESYRALFLTRGDVPRADPAKLVVEIEVTSVTGADGTPLVVD